LAFTKEQPMPTKIGPIVTLALAGLQACAQRASTSATTPRETTHMQTNRDRAAISETIHNIARGADLRQWETVRASFATRVVLDYGSPELLTPEEIIGRWQPLLSAFDSTQHTLRDERIEFIEPGRARVHSAFQATHHLSAAPGGELWTLSGNYEHELVWETSGWKVSRMRMVPGASSGNAGLLDVARKRAGLPAPPPATVTAERVTFESHGQKLVGVLRSPARNAAPRTPAVVVTGSWTTVKEQMPANYATHLAEAGFVALTFDFRGYGESDGKPRNVESAAMKAEDIRAAVRFLRGNEKVDPNRIGVLPVCASAGYTVVAANGEPGIKSIAMVAPWLHNQPILESFYGGRAGVADRLEMARAARKRFTETGAIDYVKAASNNDASAAMYWEGDALDYYLNPARGAIPQWGAKFAVMAWTEWLEFDPIAMASQLKVPTRLVTGEQTATPGGAKQFASLMTAPHDLVSLAGTQFDFYDNPKTVTAAAAAAIEHFRSTL
jgi:alpha-beta hydrolase superfamily lysophospholipase